MQTLLLPGTRGGNQALVVPHMPTLTSLPAPQHLQPPVHPNNIAAIPNHSPRPKAPVSLEKITLTRRLPPPQVSLFPCLTHRADSTHGYTEVDADFWGGSGNVEGDTMAQPQSITSSTTAKGLSLHKGLPLVMFMQKLTIPRKSKEGEES